MDASLQKKTSSFLLTALIGIIVISFMFGGYDSLRGTPDTIAKVGGLPIKSQEFQNEYNRQIQFYSQMFGGNLTSKQIETFKIKDNALQSLITQKLMLNFSKDLGLKPSKAEIKNEIKGLPYFKTNEQFDLEKYKALLARNGFTPTDFEENIANDLMLRKTQLVISNFPVSQSYIKTINDLKKTELTGTAVVINRSDLYRLVPVSSDEIKNYLANPESKAKVETLFNARKKELSQKEEVKARHILLRTDEKNEAEVQKKIANLKTEANPANFAKLADKHTEDPSGKGKGGNLDWFGKGLMAPEFEKEAFNLKPGSISAPIKTSFGYHLIYVEDHREAKDALIADHEMSLAKESIQKEKNDAIKKLEADLTANAKKLLLSKDEKAITKFVNDNQLTHQPKLQINAIDGAKGAINLSYDEVNDLFSKASAELAPFSYESPANITVLAVSKRVTTETKQETGSDASISQNFAKKFNQDLIKELEKNIKVKVYNDAFSI